MRWCVLCSSAVRETGVAFAGMVGMGGETGVAFAGLVGVGGETGVAFAGVNGPVLGGWSRALVSWVSCVTVGRRALVSRVSYVSVGRRALVSWVSYVSVGRRALVSRVSSASVGARVVAHSLHARRLELPGCSRGLMNPAARGLMQR